MKSVRSKTDDTMKVWEQSVSEYKHENKPCSLQLSQVSHLIDFQGLNTYFLTVSDTDCFHHRLCTAPDHHLGNSLTGGFTKHNRTLTSCCHDTKTEFPLN